MGKKFLFWNICNHDISSVLLELIDEHKFDFICLAEIEDAGEDLILSKINSHSPSVQYEKINTESNLCFYKKIGFYNIIEIFTPVTNRYSFLSLETTILGSKEQFLFVFVHMPSKLFKDPNEQLNDQSNLSRNIYEYEEKLQTKNTVLCGDFNLNPFEDGIINAQGINSVRCVDIATKKRTISGEKFEYFYNPSWKFLINNSGQATGTYYHDKGDFSHYWHVFDQVLLRPNLIKKFDNRKFFVLSKSRSHNLLNKNNKPSQKYSDHLPILFELNI